jgi:sugar transferase (PEP-CTERM/EpsH1 system associated)
VKILFITPDLPFPPDNGGRMRTFGFLKELSNRHVVSLLSFHRSDDDTENIEELREICTQVLTVPLTKRQLRKNKRMVQLRSIFQRMPYQYLSHYSQMMQQQISQLTDKHDFDIIQVEFSQMGYYDLPSNSVNILDQHNIEAEILYRTYRTENSSIRKLYNYIEWKKFKQTEIDLCHKFAACLTTSDHDKDILKRSSPSLTVQVIPNGVDSTFFKPYKRTTSNRNVILFTGTINYFPNTDGLKYFLKEIFPIIQREIPSTQFVIAGKNPPPEILEYSIDPHIEVTGYVKDIRECFSKASIVVVPLRIGGGTRLKILEAMAMGVPVVSTSVGAEGLDVMLGEDILIEDTPTLFAKAVVELINDGKKREKMARAARYLVENKYDWNLIGHKLEETYKGLINQRKAC